MPLVACRARRPLLVCLLVALITALLPAPVASAAASASSVEERLAELVNAERRRVGLAQLRVDVRLVDSSRRWSARMAADRRMAHDRSLPAGLPPGAIRWAENVGYTTAADAADAVHRMFMGSSTHRRNILDGRFTDIGVGVVVDRGTTWVTERFTAGAPASVSPAVEATAKLSRALFASPAATHAVIVRDDLFPDALAAGPLAGGSGPILLTPPGAVLHPSVRVTLERVLPAGATVHLVGGTAAVSDGVAREVAGAGWRVRRLAGPERVTTAAVVADAVAARSGTVGTVLLATARNWPDAASGGAFAARSRSPLLLAERDTLPAATEAALGRMRPARVVALGGPDVLSDEVLRRAGAVRVAGGTREETAVSVAAELWGRGVARQAPRWTAVPAYGGESWTWALTAAPLAARLDAAVLLAGDPLAPAVPGYLQQLDYGGGTTGELIVHGPVPSAVRSEIEAQLR